MPKDYDSERKSLAEMQRSEVLTSSVDSPTHFYILGRPISIGLAESLAGVSAVYLICIASFNAGYFSKVSGRFVELFSFSDLIGTNIPILQYFLVVYATYSGIGLIHSLVLNDYFTRFLKPIDELIVESFYWSNKRARLFWIGVIIVFASLTIALRNETFNIAILPVFFLQGLGAYWLWVGWRNGITSAKTLLSSCCTQTMPPPSLIDIVTIPISTKRSRMCSAILTSERNPTINCSN